MLWIFFNVLFTVTAISMRGRDNYEQYSFQDAVRARVGTDDWDAIESVDELWGWLHDAAEGGTFVDHSLLRPHHPADPYRAPDSVFIGRPRLRLLRSGISPCVVPSNMRRPGPGFNGHHTLLLC